MAVWPRQDAVSERRSSSCGQGASAGYSSDDLGLPPFVAVDSSRNCGVHSPSERRERRASEARR